MKNVFVTTGLCMLLFSCASGNDNKENSQPAENYPTYDTTRKQDHINDSVTDGGMRSDGDLRHNVGNGENE